MSLHLEVCNLTLPSNIFVEIEAKGVGEEEISRTQKRQEGTSGRANQARWSIMLYSGTFFLLFLSIFPCWILFIFSSSCIHSTTHRMEQVDHQRPDCRLKPEGKVIRARKVNNVQEEYRHSQKLTRKTSLFPLTLNACTRS